MSQPEIVFVTVAGVSPPGKLTPHQREVYDRLARMSRRRDPDRYVWVEGRHVGSAGACAKLIAKGWIESRVEYGPRGGEQLLYRPLGTPEVSP